MLNKVILMGRLTRDPELRYTQQNTPVVSFTLAVDRNYKAKTEGAQTADFINCVAWRNTAEFVAKWFNKGKMMVCVGSIQTRTYTDKNNEKRYVTEVLAEEVMFGETKRADDSAASRFGTFEPSNDSRQSGYSQPQYNQPQQSAPYSGGYQSSGFEDVTDDDDDLPF